MSDQQKRAGVTPNVSGGFSASRGAGAAPHQSNNSSSQTQLSLSTSLPELKKKVEENVKTLEDFENELETLDQKKYAEICCNLTK